MSQTGPPVAEALARERDRLFARINVVRVGATAVLWALFELLGPLGVPGWWQGGSAVAAAWLLVALLLALAVHRRPALQGRSALALALLDVPLAGALVWATSDVAPDPTVLVGANIGMFLLLIFISALSFDRRIVLLTATTAVVSQGAAQLHAGVPPSELLSTALLLGAFTAITVVVEGRLSHAIVRAAGQELARAMRSAELRVTEASFRRALDALPDAAVVHDEAAIVYANERAAQLLGVEHPLELVGVALLALIDEEDQEAARAHMASATNVGSFPSPISLRARRGDAVVPVECSTVAVTFEGKRLLLTVVRDLSERQQLQSRLVVADRMMSMGALAAGVAHEVNNPLTAVTCNLDLLAATLPDALSGDIEAVLASREALSEAQEATTRIRAIVRDLGTLARAEVAERRIVDLQRSIVSTVRLFAPQLRARARVVQDLGPVPPVAGSESHVRQVLLNLLVNAAQATPAGAPEDHELRITTRTDAQGDAVVEVADTGVGMTEDVAARIFEPLFTTKPLGEGTGLGLAICHQIVSAMGGTIAVDTSPGQGARFTVTLPRWRDDGPHLTPEPH